MQVRVNVHVLGDQVDKSVLLADLRETTMHNLFISIDELLFLKINVVLTNLHSNWEVILRQEHIDGLLLEWLVAAGRIAHFDDVQLPCRIGKRPRRGL